MDVFVRCLQDGPIRTRDNIAQLSYAAVTSETAVVFTHRRGTARCDSVRLTSLHVEPQELVLEDTVSAANGLILPMFYMMIRHDVAEIVHLSLSHLLRRGITHPN
jgi:hypothetical protein